MTLREAVDRARLKVIAATLKTCKGDVRVAAKRLGIKHIWLYDLMRRYPDLRVVVNGAREKTGVPPLQQPKRKRKRSA